MKKRSMAAIAAAVGAIAAIIPSRVNADSTIDYDPVVTVVGDGSALSAGNGYTTSIDVFNNSVAGQVSPLASQSYSGLITTDSTAEGALANNPAVADAAAAGTSYGGAAYVFSAGYSGTDNTATSTVNRVVGNMTVSSAGITNPTLGASYSNSVAYETLGSTAGSIRGAVGDNTASNIWTAGTGSGFTGSFRYWNNNIQDSGQATYNGGALGLESNTRTIQVRNGQLYGSSDTGNYIGISAIGIGTPENTAQNPDQSTSVLLFQTGTNSANVSPYSFLLIDNPNNPNTPTVTNGSTQVSIPYNVAYVADNGDPSGVNTDTVAGIEKWVYSPSTLTNNGWSLAYVIGDSADSGTTDNKGGYFGLAGQLLTNANTANDQVLLYGTTFATTTAGGSLEQFTDSLQATTATAADASEVTLATAPANYEFRGVALAPIVGPPNLTWDNAGGTGDGVTWDINNNQNWNNGPAPAVYTDGAAVTFNDTNNGHYAVTLNTTVSPGSVTVNSTGDYTISGSGSIAGTGSLTKSGSGTLTLATANAYTGGTNVSAGLLVIDRTSSTTSALPAGALTISGGEVQLATNVTQGSQSANAPVTPPTSNVNITSLSISGNGTLDIGNNHIIIDYSGTDPISSIAALITSGYNATGTHWTGAGITSSAAEANSGSYGIGYADAADPGNPAGLSSGQIEIMYTLLGDANLDDKVNGSDFTLMATNFNDSVTNGWDKGDFNYSGTVNGDDFVLLANNFNDFASQSAIAGADLAAIDAFAGSNGISLTSVPEPASTGLLAAGAVALLSRKRARRR